MTKIYCRSCAREFGIDVSQIRYVGSSGCFVDGSNRGIFCPYCQRNNLQVEESSVFSESNKVTTHFVEDVPLIIIKEN